MFWKKLGFRYDDSLLLIIKVASIPKERMQYLKAENAEAIEFIYQVYKLVPIKTPENPINPYQMGRIDADKMYDIVQKWDWGNAECFFQ